MNDNKSTWEFGTRQVVYGAIGAALYGVLSWATNFFPSPRRVISHSARLLPY